MEEQKTEDYKERLQKVRQRRNGKDPMHWFMIGGCAVIVVLALVIIVKLAQGGTFGGSGNARVASASEAEVQETVIGETLPEDEEQAKEDEEKKNVVESYQNLGIVDVSGYLNMRESASTTSDVIGKLMGGSACEILDDSQEGWYQISSGGLEGYISSEFVQTGEAAKTEAFELVKKMAVITTDKLNIRSEPSEDAQVLEQALKNERYSIVSEQDGWIQISGGYISADYVDVRYALNEARKLDLRTMVLNMYDNLGISNVNNYLNIRVEPKEDAKIIGKMTSKSGGEILETTEDGGWYKIKSGPVTGYVKSEFILTGDAAKQEALQVAQLMAIVSTDRLNARTEPNTDAPIWTQISNSERYSVMSQQDGWVQIALDETSAYVATEFVDVRYALNEAIEFTPVEETPEPETKAASSKGGSGSMKHLIPRKCWYDAMDEANDLVDLSVQTDIQGYDIDGDIIRAARANAKAAGVDELIHFQQRPVSGLSHPKKYGFLITNPPYGERIEEKKNLPELYKTIGERFAALDSWSAYIITAYEDTERYFGRKADKNRKIYNGMMKTYFYQFLGPKPPARKREERKEEQ